MLLHKEACSEYGRAILHIALVECTLLENFTIKIKIYGFEW